MASKLCLAGGLLAMLTSQSLAAAWTVAGDGSLMWEGQPYTPVGLRIPGTIDAINRAEQSGCKDVLVDLPLDGVQWANVVRELESRKMRYLISIDSLAPMARGIAVEPEGYRVPKIKGPTRVEFSLTNADFAIAALVYAKDGAVEWIKREGLKFNFFSDVVGTEKSDLEQLLLVYPHLEQLSFPDYWSGLDRHRDQLLRVMMSAKFGPGLRGFLNPLGELSHFPNRNQRFIPTDPLFRIEFESYLRKKYSSAAPVIRTWNLKGTDFDTLREMTGLIPLWGGSRGIGHCFSLDTGEFYTADMRRSLYWDDLFSVVQQTSVERYTRLIEGMRQIANVPIIQDWRGWNGPYQSRDCPLTGVGAMVAGDTALEVAETIGRTISSTLSTGRALWLPATQIQLGKRSWEAALQDSAAIGAKAWFFEPTEGLAISDLSSRGQQVAGQAISSGALRPLFFPESATHAANTMKLPNGLVWLPAPGDGDRVDLGAGYDAYRYKGKDAAYFVIWSPGGPRRVLLHHQEPKALTFESVDGTDPKVKVTKKGVEVTIGTWPLVIRGSEEISIPADAVNETLNQFSGFKTMVGPGLASLEQDVLAFQDAVASFDRSPGSSFIAMRRSIAKLNLMVSPFQWVEAESSRDHTFSEVMQVFGASNNNVLNLTSKINLPIVPIYARYAMSAHVAGTHSVWIAARIPKNVEKSVSVMVGDRIFKLSGSPTQLYGEGFGWYRVGELDLPKDRIDVEVRVAGADTPKVALDVIALAPGDFKPNGSFAPNILPTTAPKKVR